MQEKAQAYVELLQSDLYTEMMWVFPGLFVRHADESSWSSSGRQAQKLSLPKLTITLS